MTEPSQAPPAAPLVGGGRAARWRPGAGAALAAVLALVYFPVLLGQVIFFRDPANWTYPARFFLRKVLLEGAPWWNPQQGLGFSVAASPLYGLFYPPHVLYLLVPERAVVHMMTWQSLGHLAAGGLGIVLLLRRFRAPEIAAFVGGATWALSGYVTAQWTAGILLLADAWVPWCGLGFVVLGRALDTRGWRSWARGLPAAAAPVAACCLLGELFVALMGAAFGLGTALVDARQRRREAAAPSDATGPRPGAIALAGLAAAAAGALVAAVVIVPASLGAGATDRGRPLDRALAEVASLHPLRLVEFAAPGSMGVPYEHYPAGRWLNEAALDGTPLSFSMYLGASALALAAIALGRRRWLATGFAVLAAAALVIALGRHTPVHGLLRRVIPVLAYMRYPEKYMVLVTSWLALLAGLGAARLVASEPAARACWRRPLALVGLLVALAALGGVFPAELASYVRKGALTGAGAAAGVAVAWWLGRRRPLAGALLLALVVSGDLAAAAVGLQHFGPGEVATQAAPVVEAIARESAGDPAPPRAYRSRSAEDAVARLVPVRSHAEGQARAMAVLVENASTTFGVAMLPGYDAAIPAAESRLWAEGQKRAGLATLRLFGARFAVLAAPPAAESPARQAVLEPVMDPAPGARLYRVRAPLPRAYLAGHAEVVEDEAGRPGLFEEGILDGGAVQLAPGPGVVGLAGARGRAGTCRIEAFARGRIEAVCHAEREAIAVFAEQHDPGWRAELDGAPAPLLRANGVFRAVRVAPGDHRIRLFFTPAGLRLGATLSVLAGLGLLACVLLGRRRAGAPAG